MNRIGTTSTGSVIVELTSAEFSALESLIRKNSAADSEVCHH
jgi:hypothetical protein